MKTNKFHTFAILLCFLITSCYESSTIPLVPASISQLFKEHSGKPLLVLLYRTDCQWCRKELTELPDILSTPELTDLVTFGFSLNNDINDVNYYNQHSHLPFAPYWLEFETFEELYSGFNQAEISLPKSFGVPLLILLDHKHQQQHLLVGYQQKESLLEKLKSL